MSYYGYDHAFALVERYHVPRSQCYEGSRGGQSGKVHLHVNNGPTRFTAASGRSITRGGGVALCLRNGWYARAQEADEHHARCPRCVALAERYGVEWPVPA